ncbi:MAG: hypothetical protein IJX19_00465 [Clostridia bacterium]|nr:hypothetical protein [Clostridia bacterium]
MKFRFLKLFFLCVALVSLLTACSKIPTMEMKDGAYVNQKTKISYTHASSCYRANEYVEKAVGKIEHKGQAELLLYPISGMDEKKWLCDADFSVYCAVGVTPPALWEMSIGAVYINKTVNASYTVQKIVDAEKIASLIKTYREGTSFSYDDISHADMTLKPNPQRYDLVFEDSSLSYYLIYLQFEEEVLVYEVVSDPNNFTPAYPGVEVTTETYKGEHYAVYHFGKHIMYNRETGRCYPVNDVIAPYFEEE